MDNHGAEAAAAEASSGGGIESSALSPQELAASSNGDDDDDVEIILDVRGGDESQQVGADLFYKGLIFVPPHISQWYVERRFDQLAVDGCLRRSKFGEFFGYYESDEFAAQLFDALAWRRKISRSWITKAELIEFWKQISSINFDIRLQTFVDIWVKNTDGRITEEVLKKMIALSASANKLPKVEEQALEYARLFMEEFDTDNLGYIELVSLKTLLQSPTQSGRISTTNSGDLSQMLSQMLRPSSEPNPLRRWYCRVQDFVEDHWQRLWMMLLWLSVCAGLFAWKFVQYRRRYVFQVMGYCVCVAKGSAETLKFNMALILIPVCRNAISWLLNFRFVTRAVPIHDSINSHKVIAVGIAIGTGLHAMSHLTCNFPRLLRATDAEYAPLAQYFGTERDWRPPDYWWYLKGTEGWTGLVMLVLMVIASTLALPGLRRGRVQHLHSLLKLLTGFNAFWYSHHLFIVVYALLIVHGHFLYLTHKWYNKSTWMYLAVPVLLYAGERLVRALRSSMLPVNILKVVVYPPNTMSLHFSKPPGFRYKSGQYIFLKCPTISPFQWHPFYITSAPQDNYLSVHIRTLGDWTHHLYSEVSRPPMDGKSGLLRAEYDHDRNMTSNKSLTKVLIDGPYSLMAQDYKQYEAVFLISLGIGAAPMISILKDIINNMKQLHGDTESGDATNNSMSSSSFRTRRVYFYWVTRDQGSFDWFRSIMDEVAEAEKMGIIEFNTYFTRIYEEGHVRSVLIPMLQSLYYAKNGIDIVSGTHVKAHFSRPNWRNVYKRIALNHYGQRVGVFYCGAPVLAEELRELARDFSRKTITKFEFYKEDFLV